MTLKAIETHYKGYRFRSAPLPSELRTAPLVDARAVYDPAQLSQAVGSLLEVPPPVDVRHITVVRVTVAERLAVLRRLLSRGRFTFSEAVGDSDRVTVAVTLYALLELYKQGEATWDQPEPFAEIMVTGPVPSSVPAPEAELPERRLTA